MQTRGRHWSMGLGQGAFGMLLLGLMMAVGALIYSGPQGVAAEVAAMQPRDHAGLRGVGRAETVLVEGRVSPESTAVRGRFVAYTRKRLVRDIRDDELWTPDGQETPALQVEIPGGVINLIDGPYTLAGGLLTIREGEYEYAGIVAGDQVLVLGHVARGLEGGDFIATNMVRGTRAEVTGRHVDRSTLVIGLCLAGAGAGIMGWLLRRGYSPWSTSATGK